MRLRIVCAPNAFRGTIGAADAARALSLGVADSGGDAVRTPMADGGDGTLEILLAAAPLSRAETLRVHGPLGGGLLARLGWIEPGIAVVELAEAAGLRRLSRPNRALLASSRGAGELIAGALDRGARRIVVGVGGSACTDGGAGLLMALGARLLNARGRPIGWGGGALLDLHSADLAQLDARLQGVQIEVATDVISPLLGEEGAVTVFAPQKGATPAERGQLEAGLERLCCVLERDAGVAASLRLLAGAGAGGGSGYGLSAIGGELVGGAALVADAIDLDRAIRSADLVITGEGRLDLQTAAGKAPMEVARRAAQRGVPCVAVAGSVEGIPEGFAGAISLTDLAGAGEDPRRMPRRLLRRAAATLTRRWSATPRTWGFPR